MVQRAGSISTAAGGDDLLKATRSQPLRPERRTTLLISRCSLFSLFSLFSLSTSADLSLLPSERLSLAPCPGTPVLFLFAVPGPALSLPPPGPFSLRPSSARVPALGTPLMSTSRPVLSSRASSRSVPRRNASSSEIILRGVVAGLLGETSLAPRELHR